ncbi:MAG: hypothetical protein JW855_03345 [Gammaproteobacteria bacterium]|nr:hypothetical protein [Gammaproteobacteria bacterium]
MESYLKALIRFVMYAVGIIYAVISFKEIISNRGEQPDPTTDIIALGFGIVLGSTATMLDKLQQADAERNCCGSCLDRRDLPKSPISIGILATATGLRNAGAASAIINPLLQKKLGVDEKSANVLTLISAIACGTFSGYSKYQKIKEDEFLRENQSLLSRIVAR